VAGASVVVGASVVGRVSAAVAGVAAAAGLTATTSLLSFFGATAAEIALNTISAPSAPSVMAHQRKYQGFAARLGA
jgi:hypothetical protein